MAWLLISLEHTCAHNTGHRGYLGLLGQGGPCWKRNKTEGATHSVYPHDSSYSWPLPSLPAGRRMSILILCALATGKPPDLLEVQVLFPDPALERPASCVPSSRVCRLNSRACLLCLFGQHQQHNIMLTFSMPSVLSQNACQSQLCDLALGANTTLPH